METFTQIAFPLVVLAVMMIGLLSLLTTIIPGLVIIWAAALVYGLVEGFTLVSGILFAVITTLMLAGGLADNLLMGASARSTGASWLSIGAALLAGLAGSLVWPPFGGLLAALGALFLLEYLRLRDVNQAWNSTRSMAAGCGWAVAVRLLIGMVMIGLWLVWVFAL